MNVNQKEIEKLKSIVNYSFSVNLSANNKKKEVIIARSIYSKIMREKGYTFDYIGKSLGKSHGAICHYINTVDLLLSENTKLRDKYFFCKDSFLNTREPFKVLSDKDLEQYMFIMNLQNELEEAINSKTKLLYHFVDYMEGYQTKKGIMPSIEQCRNYIIPLFKNQ